ncbi:MAG: hypothetical protein IJD45_01930 [Clostridia bacterium]|nr:hypothetical protein [Clostridia bacterium]
MDTFKILGFIFVAAALCLILKGYKTEYAFALAVCSALAVLTLILKNIAFPLKLIQEKIAESGIDGSYFKVAVKALGIGYITSFVAEACRDAGQNSLALKAELTGKCAIFILSVPLILSILETALGFTK